MEALNTLKSVEVLRKAIETFENKVNEMKQTAADLEARISKMEIEQVQLLTAGDVAGSVLMGAKIVAMKAEVSAVRMSTDLMTKNKFKGFDGLLEDVRLEAEDVRLKCLKSYEKQELKVLSAIEAFLSELEALGAIRTEAVEANMQFKDAAQAVENMKPKELRKSLYYSFPLKFEQKPLFTYTDPYNPGSKAGIIGVLEKAQEDAYAGKLK